MTNKSKYNIQYANDANVSSAIHPEDFIYRFCIEHPLMTPEEGTRHYFFDGKGSAEKFDELVFAELGYERETTSVLEFASGYGCVTRHLCKFIPVENLTSSDIHPAANNFLTESFGVQTIQSTNLPENFPIDRKFDVVFALSFFSHMPDRTWGLWLKVLFELLNENGTLIFTTHGEVSRKHFGNQVIPESGIWFAANSEQKDIESHEYGSTIVSLEYVMNQIIVNLNNVLIRKVKPSFWWEHQDLYVLQKKRLSS